MNNIRLSSNYDGTWDWSFNRNDLDNCIGIDSIISSCQHVILLKRNELIQEVYDGKGNLAWNYIKSKPSSTNLTRISEATVIELKQVEGVKDATVTASLLNGDVSLNTTIMLEDGYEVEIDGV